MDEMWAGVSMSVQQGKWRVPSWSSSQFLSNVQGKRTLRGGLMRGANPVVVDLNSGVSAPECKVSTEKKRASQAVQKEQGNLLEENERVAGP